MSGRNAFLSGKPVVPVAQAKYQRGGKRVNVVRNPDSLFLAAIWDMLSLRSCARTLHISEALALCSGRDSYCTLRYNVAMHRFSQLQRRSSLTTSHGERCRLVSISWQMLWA